jgi:hypothetical protein
MKKTCTKDLFKSTYHGLAFKKGHQYEVIEEDGRLIWLVDERHNKFSFVKTPGGIMYFVGDYFT